MATRQTYLDIGDLIDVLDLLKRCGFEGEKWQELGLRLGLLKDTLEAIKTMHHSDVNQCLTECLSQSFRLCRADNVDSRGGVNLDSLSDALRSMNETTVVEKLKHHVVLINIFNNCHTVLSQSLCDSVSIAWLLYGECMLTQEAVSRVVSASPSIPHQREALLTAVKEAVETDPNSLHTFANVLCTISTNVSLGQAILDDISKNYPTPEVVMVPGINEDHDEVPQDNTSTDETKAIANTQSGTCTHNTDTSSSSSQSLSSQGDCVCTSDGPVCQCRRSEFGGIPYTGTACQCSVVYCYDTSIPYNSHSSKACNGHGICHRCNHTEPCSCNIWFTGRYCETMINPSRASCIGDKDCIRCIADYENFRDMCPCQSNAKFSYMRLTSSDNEDHIIHGINVDSSTTQRCTFITPDLDCKYTYHIALPYHSDGAIFIDIEPDAGCIEAPIKWWHIILLLLSILVVLGMIKLVIVKICCKKERKEVDEMRQKLL